MHTNDKYYGKELSDEIVTRSRSLGIIIKERVVYDPNEEKTKFDKKLEQVFFYLLFDLPHGQLWVIIEGANSLTPC